MSKSEYDLVQAALSHIRGAKASRKLADINKSLEYSEYCLEQLKDPTTTLELMSQVGSIRRNYANGSG